MSLELQLAGLVTATNQLTEEVGVQVESLAAATGQLTAEVSGKMAAIDQTVAAKKAELDAWRNDSRAEYPVINVFANNLLMSGAVAGVEDGIAGVKGAVPAGFYGVAVNVESIIKGKRQFVSGEYGMILPSHCPTPTIIRVKFIPRPYENMNFAGGGAFAPIPFAWGYPLSIAGSHVTHSFFARVAEGPASIYINEGTLIDGAWRRVVARMSGNDADRAHWIPILVDFADPIEMEFMLPHVFLGHIPDQSLPVYAKAVQILG